MKFFFFSSLFRIALYGLRSIEQITWHCRMMLICCQRLYLLFFFFSIPSIRHICVYSFHLTIQLNKWSTICGHFNTFSCKMKNKSREKNIDMWWHLQHFLRLFISFLFSMISFFTFSFRLWYFVISDRHIAAVPSLTSLIQNRLSLLKFFLFCFFFFRLFAFTPNAKPSLVLKNLQQFIDP